MTDRPVSPTRDAATVDRDEPWPGLAAFREADRQFFHGRERAIDEIVRLVLRAPVTVLFGLSGLGKTSLLRAGVFPPLREAHLLPVYIRLSHADDSPGFRDQVRAALIDASSRARLEAPPWDVERTLWEYFHRRDVRFWNDRNRIITPLLVFDQFEEVFTQGRLNGPRASRTAQFLGELADLVEGRPPSVVRERFEESPDEALQYSLADRPCKVLVSLREDFLPDLSSLRTEMPSIGDTSYRLQRMSAEEALEVVQLDGGRLVDRDVAEAIVDFVASAKGEESLGESATRVVEPALLSVFCRELNAKRRAAGLSKITADLLQGTAGNQIISDFYERTISEAGLNPSVRTFVEERLLTESGFRDSVAEEQALRSADVTAEDLEALISRRLLRREDAGTPGRARVELTHDVLAEAVRVSRDRRRLREEQERRLAARREAEERARAEAEEAAKKERQRLDLEAARALATKEREAAELAQTLAVQEQRAREAAERTVHVERQARVRLRWLLVALAALVAVSTAFWWDARQSEQASRRALATADVYRVMLGDDQPLALLAHAVRSDPDNELARTSLIRALSREPRLVGELPERAEGDVILDPDGRYLLRVSDQAVAIWDVARGETIGQVSVPGVRQATFTADGARFITIARAEGGDETEVQVWDVATGGLVSTPFKVLAPVEEVAASTDGRRVVLVFRSDQAQVWDTPAGEPVGPAIEEVAEADLSPDGSVLLTQLYDGTAQLSPVGSSGGEPLLLGEPGSTESASFSPRGDRVVTISLGDFNAHVWDARSGAQVGEALVHDESVTIARMSPDGRRVLTVDSDETVRLWSIAGAVAGDAQIAPLGSPMPHDRPVTDARFSPDGMRVVTTSLDRSVRVWDAWTGHAVAAPLRFERPILAATMSRDGKQVITVSSGRGRGGSMAADVRVSDVRSGIVVGTPVHPGGPVSAAVFSPDGSSVVTTSADLDDEEGQVLVWNADDGTQIAAPGGYGGHVLALVTAPEVGVLLAESDDSRVRIWNALDHRPVLSDLAHDGTVLSVAFSGDFSRLATTTVNQTVQVWDLQSGEAVGTPFRSDTSINAAMLSPSGDTVLTVSIDGKARLWNVTTGEATGSVFEHDDVASAGFSPDGTLVVTASSDGSARAWELATGEEVGAPMLHEGPIISVAFSPDGDRLVTASADGTSRVWDVLTGFPISDPFRHRAEVVAASFSPDGARVVTASTDGTARLWDVGASGADSSALLADLSEAVGGYRVDGDSLSRVDDRAAILERIRRQTADAEPGSHDGFARWLLTDPWERSVSPLSALSVPDYIRRLIDQDGSGGCEEAWRTFPGHPALQPCPETTPETEPLLSSRIEE